MFRLAICLFMLSFTIHSIANCDFIEAEYIDELNSPEHIKSIEITVPKSSKFLKNALKILLSPAANIDPQLRKRFRAKVNVRYPFGLCKHEASVRQNGDWKDHIAFVPVGKITQSLDVKLRTGNILNSVRFKLLIPTTRGGEKEVLGALLLRQLGFIAPETFLVDTNINGFSSKMLFQEVARKELLERNNRREGPIFEGDETLLWSTDLLSGSFIDSLEKLSLARLTNENWFKKGVSSESITINAFNRLQHAYLEYALGGKSKRLLVYPNNEKTLFDHYFLTLSSMNSWHALRGHNRKFYFNSFEQKFEPIYYDGNLSFTKLDISDDKMLNKEILSKVVNQLGSKKEFFRHIFEEKILKKEQELINELLKRVKKPKKEVQVFFKQTISTIVENRKLIYSLVSENKGENLPSASNYTNLETLYSSTQENFELPQTLFASIERYGDYFIGRGLHGKVFHLNLEQVAEILSENTLDGQRAVLIGQASELSNIEKIQTVSLPSQLGGSLMGSDTLEVEIDTGRRLIMFTQTKAHDWALISSADLTDWNIEMKGYDLETTAKDQPAQRFNRYGMTGCLNFYKTLFGRTNVFSDARGCEDSVNFVSSSGNLDKLSVTDAYSDAIDMDFSDLTVSEIIVNSAGNDCLDVSGGKYIVHNFLATDCGDKGLSVGEKSVFESSKLTITDSILGISSKDSSVTKIGSARILKTPNCFESKRKKQEFGGAYIQFDSLDCAGLIETDSNSIAKVLQ